MEMIQKTNAKGGIMINTELIGPMALVKMEILSFIFNLH
jgi:hypothetical protein